MINQKGLTQVVIILSVAVFAIIFSYFFLTSPHKVGGQPIQPFKEGELLLSEKITYLFKSVQIGDRVIFFPTTRKIDHLGIIVGIEEKGDIKTYKIVSGKKGTIWSVSPEKITGRIYYPFVSKEEIDSIISSLSSEKSAYVGDIDSTGVRGVTWKTYTNTTYNYSVEYPTDWTVDENFAPKTTTFVGGEFRHELDDKPPLVSISVFESTKFNKEEYINDMVFEHRIIERNNYTYVFLANTYGIGLAPSEETVKQAKNILEKIHSTFKFLDQK